MASVESGEPPEPTDADPEPMCSRPDSAETEPSPVFPVLTGHTKSERRGREVLHNGKPVVPRRGRGPMGNDVLLPEATDAVPPGAGCRAISSHSRWMTPWRPQEPFS